MTDLPPLTESEIQDWVGDPSFDRGRLYYEQGRILDPRRQGVTLQASCSGSRPQPYHVEIILDSLGIVSGFCSCPVGAGGYCKHAAALLFTWLHEPDAFQEIGDQAEGLQGRSKAELVALIHKMMQRYPDLEELLALPKPDAPDSDSHTVAQVVQRQVDAAFARAGQGWRSASQVAQEVRHILGTAAEYAQNGKGHLAATVYATLAHKILERWLESDDEAGHLTYIVYQCSEGLGRCLEATNDATQRGELVQALFDIYQWDIDAGGVGMGDNIPELLLRLANPDERRRIAEWVRQALPQGDSWTDDFHRKTYGGFLLTLLETELDDAAFLQICRDTGRLEDLVERLLTLHRLEEALAVAKAAGDYDLLRLADLFVLHDQAARVEGLIRERSETSRDSRLTAWLKARAEESGDLSQALACAEVLFWQRPNTEGYQELQRLAQGLGRWTSLRTECLTRLQNDGDLNLLTRIHLYEGNLNQALEMLKKRDRKRVWGSDTLSLEVAQAAEKSRPRDAIQLYMGEVECFIAARARGSYADAATYLLRVRALLGQLEEQQTWQTLIADLRAEHKRLPAMQDEFDKAGL